MTAMGEIIELQPGSRPANATEERPDWSPEAQPPDPTTGIIAHTPDPTKYHRSIQGRTILPRSKANQYGSRGFDAQRPGIVNIDPNMDGSGGFSVDIEKVTKAGMDAAVNQAGGNPLAAWAIAGQQQVTESQIQIPEPAPRLVPEGQTGYLVPQATVGGAQLKTAVAPNLAGIASPQALGVVQNPHVKPAKGQEMMPQTIPTQQEIAATQVPVAVAAHPQSVQLPPQVVQVSPNQLNAAPPQGATAIVPDPVQAAMLTALSTISTQLQNLQPVPSTQLQDLQPAPAPEEARMIDAIGAIKLDWEEERRLIKEEVQKLRIARNGSAELPEDPEEAQQDGALPNDCELPFLTNPPSKPRIQVVFDLNAGGQHSVWYHSVAVSGLYLSLLYDGRYEGNQFIPPATREEDPPIKITFPADNKQVQARVPEGCNQRIGCMDVFNFVIVDPQVASSLPQMITPEMVSPEPTGSIL